MPVRLTVCSLASSAIVMLLIASSVGVSLVEVTMTSKSRVMTRLSPLLLRLPSGPASSTVTEMVAVPFWLATGVNFKLPVALPSVWLTVGVGTSPGLSLLAVTRTDSVSLRPGPMPVRLTVCSLASSAMVMLLIASSVGVWLIVVTSQPISVRPAQSRLVSSLRVPTVICGSRAASCEMVVPGRVLVVPLAQCD